jgi:hypothetical protein
LCLILRGQLERTSIPFPPSCRCSLSKISHYPSDALLSAFQGVGGSDLSSQISVGNLAVLKSLTMISHAASQPSDPLTEAEGGPFRARYLPGDAELARLSKDIHEYHSTPERSDKRNEICAEAAQYLQCLNPHWPPRNVRLWFNNNK